MDRNKKLVIGGIAVGVAFLLLILTYGWEFKYVALAMIGFILAITTSFKPAKAEVENPFDLLSVNGEHLLLKAHQIPLDKINKVVIDEVDSVGILQLPFNQINGEIPEVKFDKQHLGRLREFIGTHLPKAEIIT